MKFEPIVTYIEDNYSGYKGGKNIFVNQAPSTTDTLILLKDGAGGTKIDGEIETERRGPMQLVVRGSNYSKIKQIADDLSEILNIRNVELEGMYVKVLRPMHEPISYPLSVGNNFEVSVNFSIVYGIVPN